MIEGLIFKIKTMTKRTVIIDNGHGYDTPGKRSMMSNNIMFEEWEFTRMIKLRLISKLQAASYPFYDLVPESNDISLNMRVNRERSYTSINKDKKPFLISIHGDAYSNKNANGVTVFSSKGETQADEIGDIFVDGLSKLGFGDRYDVDKNGNKGREANFYILRNSYCPAILVELGFYTNEKQAICMHDDMVQENIAQLMFESILKVNDTI